MNVHRSLVAAALLGLAPAAYAQHTPKHEFGVDMMISSAKSSSDDAPSSAFPRVLSIATPVDVRIGFVSQGKMMLETRFGLVYSSASDTDFDEGRSVLLFTPGVNLMYRLAGGSGLHNQMGAYLTVGGDVGIARSSGDGDSETTTQFAVNAGIGTRKAMGSIALRPELFFKKAFENDDAFGRTAFGLRLGLSFWH